MPEAISRSSVNQIASYGPPEELSSQAPKADVKAPAQSSAEAMPLEKADKKQMSYEKCIALYERRSIDENRPFAAAGGCAKFVLPGIIGGAAVGGGAGALAGAALGCAGGAREAMYAAIAASAMDGTVDGKIACDDLPKKQ